MRTIRDESGSATVLALAIISVAIFTFTAIAVGFSVSYEYRKVQQAADLSALAGAANVLTDAEKSCPVAKELARLNNATIENCEVGLGEVQVQVRSIRFGWIRAIANAGIF